jgi:hypothetical protein
VTYADTLLDDFQKHDNLQVITLIQGGTSHANIDAINKDLTWKQAMMGAALDIEATDEQWLLGCKSLGAVVPERGDTIETAGGDSWTIVTVTMRSMGDTPIYYTAISRKQL